MTIPAANNCFYFSNLRNGIIFPFFMNTSNHRRGLVLEGGAILIAPEKPLEISRVCHDPETMQRVYDLGRKAADQAIAASNRGDWAWH